MSINSTVDSIMRAANDEAKTLSPQEAFDLFAELAEQFEASANALREDNEPDSEDW